MAEVDVSIVIPTKNGAAYLMKTLEMIYVQSYPQPFEVIVIDSGSVDSTLDIVKRYPARLVEIRPEDFGHGKTRNLGAEFAEGTYLVFITQDAIPATDRWLFNLVRNLECPEVAGIYGRQIPWEDTNPVERFFLNTRYPAYRMVKSVKQGKIDMDTIFFSNVNSAIKKEVFQRYPLLENLIMSEDQEWAKRVLLNGYEIVYDPEAAVYHSHNF
ncbi:MAG: glycosyltransferase, partial [Dehalococcoidia bacterium]|nr:glycosyltransferase [Dehalococcoidia bacterium]